MGAGVRGVMMPVQVWGLAAGGSVGLVYVTSYAGRGGSIDDLDTTVLTPVDPAGTTMWQRTFAGHPCPPRIDPDGAVWIAHTDGGNPPVFTLTGLGADGRRLRSVIPQQAPQYLGVVVQMPDGFCVLWLPIPPAHLIGDGVARLARYDDNRGTMWTTPIPLLSVSLPGWSRPARPPDGRDSP